MTKIAWTSEAIARLEKSRIDALLQNARRLGADDVAALCENELAQRAPVKPTAKSIRTGSATSEYVAGYHFVCGGRRGVVENNDGTFWTGAWVVSRANVDESLKFGAYVALHESKNEDSYIQGEILEYRLRERDMIDKENVGIEFRCSHFSQSKVWVGGGSGEKGYYWQRLAEGCSR